MFERVRYEDLNDRQKENYNFHKVAAVLADYGFNSLRLNDDWEGADFIALHIDGRTALRVQLKGRLTLEKKYAGKGIHVAFLHDGELYLYPHDALMELVLAETTVGATKSWTEVGGYSWSRLGVDMLARIERWKLPSVAARGGAT
jgi:hypothetical protein